MQQRAGTALELENVTKRYGATVALDDVSFTLAAGEVCGLLGENGAGKSTMVKVLSGVVAPDTGQMRLAGESFGPRSVVEARARGVSTAFQELSLVPALSVAMNLFLPRPPVGRAGLVSTRKLEDAARQILAEHDVLDVKPSAIIQSLPLGVRQRVEIVRAVQSRPRVLLLDEPTAALSDREWLFSLMDRLVREGTSILYISHKLDEIRRLCERCVILRNGRKVLDSALTDLSDAEIFSNMAGRSVTQPRALGGSAMRVEAQPLLAVDDLDAEGVRSVSLSVRPGEILGLAGLEGHGQSELFKALVGLVPKHGGAIRVEGRNVSFRSPRAARNAGIVLVPEERKSEGIFEHLSTQANISLPAIDSASAFGLIRRRAERRIVEPVAADVSLSPRYLPLGISALSGGNQQKAVLARALAAGAKCLLLFDPTRGVDVGAKQHIYGMMRKFTQDGGAILFYSTELEELVNLADRCLVMYQGATAGEVASGDLSQDAILALALGHGEKRRTRAPQASEAGVS